MHSRKHIEWLEQNNLLEKSRATVEPLKKVFQKCLNAKKEEVLIIGDQGFLNEKCAGMLAGGYYLAAKELGLPANLVIQQPKFKGDTADGEVIEAFYDLPAESIIVLALSNKLGSIKQLAKSFRVFSKERNHRFVSALSLGNLETNQFDFLRDAIDVDYKELAERGKRVKEQLDKGDEVRITTDAGTDLYVNIAGKKSIVNVGNYRKPGKGGNIPAGEVYTPPKWKQVDGTVVVDGSSACREGTIVVKEPIKLTIKKDEIVNIEGGKEAKQLENTLEWAYNKAKYPWGIRRIGELGIGINPKARIVGATIIDEKSLGTAHIGIGSNYWFGGTIYAIIHLDQIFRNPKVYVDGKLLEIK